MSLESRVEKQGNILTQLKQLTNILPGISSLIHLSNLITDQTIPFDFRKVDIFTQAPVYNHESLTKMYGESEYEIVQRLKKKLGNRGIIYRYAEKHYKQLFKK